MHAAQTSILSLTATSDLESTSEKKEPPQPSVDWSVAEIGERREYLAGFVFARLGIVSPGQGPVIPAAKSCLLAEQGYMYPSWVPPSASAGCIKRPWAAAR